MFRDRKKNKNVNNGHWTWRRYVHTCKILQSKYKLGSLNTDHRTALITIACLPADSLPLLLLYSSLNAWWDHKLGCLTPLFTKVEQIVSVFHSASKQKAWDHFSKAQRKNLHMWRKQAEVSNFLILSFFSVHLQFKDNVS